MTIDELFNEAFVSPYRMAQIVNEAFSIDLPPQMFYQYVGKAVKAEEANKVVSPNMIRTFIHNNKRVVSRDEVIRWMKQYAVKKSYDFNFENHEQLSLEDA